MLTDLDRQDIIFRDHNFTPFGYRYEGNACTVKLRFKRDKFEQAGIKELGTYQTTRSGYIIFEARFDVKSDLFKVFNAKIKTLQQQKPAAQ
jgi:hypothetical protein